MTNYPEINKLSDGASAFYEWLRANDLFLARLESDGEITPVSVTLDDLKPLFGIDTAALEQERLDLAAWKSPAVGFRAVYDDHEWYAACNACDWTGPGHEVASLDDMRDESRSHDDCPGVPTATD